ncbi:MAG: sodium:solute symporter family protein [Victivallaceae bacterium]|nr:sodium:solute symporter family protein [Victivallaceae bacterium]
MENQLDGAAAASNHVVGSLGLTSGTLYMLYIGIGVYILIMLLIGVWSSRRVKGMNDFLVAGRRLPLWMATATLLATWFGAGSSMGVAATVYTDGIGGVLADPFGASFSLIFAGIFIVGMLRRLKCLTVTDIIERRYGKGAGIYASAWMIPVYIGWLGAQLLGMGTILYLLTGMDVASGTMIGAVVVLLYTLAGGMWAVTLTDVVQVSLIVIGLFLIIPGAISEAGGPSVLIGRLSSQDVSMWIPEGATHTDIVYYIGSWIVMGLGCMVGQDLIQRSLSSRNEKIAVSSSVMSGFFYAAIGLVPITIGFAARAVLAKYGVTAETMGDGVANQVLPRMAIIVLGNLNPLVLTVFLAALISAIMSSADSSLLAGSSLLCNNVIAPLAPRMSDKSLLRLTRISTVVLTLLATFLALKVDSIYSLMINSWSSQLVVVFLPVMTALYVPSASKNAAWATMAVSTAVWLTYTFVAVSGMNASFSEILNNGLDYAMTCGAVYGFCAGLIAFVCCWLGERIPHWRLDTGDDEEE